MFKQTSSLERSHFPVMLNEVIEICTPDNGGVFLDCTFGGGGYSRQLLKYSKTKVIALDRDTFVLNIAKELKKNIHKDLHFIKKNLVKPTQLLKIKKSMPLYSI